jgi:hypothetical protein
MIFQKFTMNLFRVLRPFAEVHTRNCISAQQILLTTESNRGIGKKLGKSPFTMIHDKDLNNIACSKHEDMTVSQVNLRKIWKCRKAIGKMTQCANDINEINDIPYFPDKQYLPPHGQRRKIKSLATR